MLTAVAKKNITNLSLLLLSVAILLVVGVSAYFRNAPSKSNTVEFRLKENETQSISFGSMELRPGESCAYTLLLSSEDAKQALLQFEDREPTLELKHYVRVRVEQDGAVLCDALLAELLEQNAAVPPAPFSEQKQRFEITFYMPEDVGNEAQNAKADFRLLVTASNE